MSREAYSQVLNNGGATSQKHGRDHDVGEAAEDDEDAVGDAAIPGLDDLEEGMGVGGSALELDGECREQDDLDGGTGGVPEGTGHTTEVLC